MTTPDASANSAHLAYVVMYVEDVPKTAEFYSRAFGLAIRDKYRSDRWAEMETGATTLAFTPLKQHESAVTGGVIEPSFMGPSNNIQVNLVFTDLDAAFKHAIEQGATPVAKPEDKQWLQKLAHVRDINGNLVCMGSYMAEKTR